MCPDRQILSLYMDKELPSPWREKMDAHLATCQECRSRLEQYQKLSSVLEQDRVPVSPEAQRRVWNRIMSQRPASRKRVWKRNVSLPIPLAAAAAAVFVFVSFLAIQGAQYPGLQNQSVNAPVVAASQAIVPYSVTANMGSNSEDMLLFSDMNSVLQYLSREESADFVFIELPETQNFYNYGEPAFLKAVDYSEGKPNR